MSPLGIQAHGGKSWYESRPARCTYCGCFRRTLTLATQAWGLAEAHGTQQALALLRTACIADPLRGGLRGQSLRETDAWYHPVTPRFPKQVVCLIRCPPAGAFHLELSIAIVAASDPSRLGSTALPSTLPSITRPIPIDDAHIVLTQHLMRDRRAKASQTVNFVIGTPVPTLPSHGPSNLMSMRFPAPKATCPRNPYVHPTPPSARIHDFLIMHVL